MRKVNKSSLKAQMRKKGYLFMIPFTVGFIFYFMVVISKSVIYSFSENSLSDDGLVSVFNGWTNYIYAFTEDKDFTFMLTSAVTSLLYSVPVVLIFSLFIAVILNQKMRGRVLFRAVFFIPVIVATGLIAKIDANNLMLTAIGNTSVDMGEISKASGFISYDNIQNLILSLGLGPQFTNYILTAVNTIISTINLSGVQILIFLSGLQSISPSIYESAKIEGASGWECFWKITFPMISPLILVNLFYSVIDYFTQTTSPLMSYIDNLTNLQGMRGEASAMAWIYFICIAAILLVAGLIVSRFVFYQQREK